VLADKTILLKRKGLGVIDTVSSMSRPTLVTVSIPVFNEADNIDRLLARLDKVAKLNSAYAFEFLFTDNASTDGTFIKLAEKAAHDPRIRVLRFSRNFGFQRSTLTNLVNARGEAAIQIDADLQDPPELISEFLAKWREGYKVVYGIRRRRIENWALRLGRKIHYRLIQALSDVPVPLDAGEFRLIDRVIIEQLKTYVDHNPYLRGLIASLGFPQIGIPYDRSERIAGQSKFNFSKLLILSIDGICSQSTRPLQYISMFGFVTSILSLLLIVAYLVSYLLSVSYAPRGFTTLVLLVLMSIGMNAAVVGLLGEYVGRIYNNVRGGPTTIIVERIESPQEAPRSEKPSETLR
jgi:dolichol-phosphate mannosyltransferase